MSLHVLIAEDSDLFVEILVDILDAEPGLEIVAIADNGVDAVEACEIHQPDIVLMDIHMPRLDGLSATEEIMARCPTPILVITSDPHRDGVDLSFRALSAGALDLMAKPDQLPFPESDRERLLRKIRLLSQIPVVRHVRARNRRRSTPDDLRQHRPRAGDDDSGPAAIIGVVGSTGGPRALANICTELPDDFPGCLVIVQHITHGFTNHLARWLDKHSPLRVYEAQDGDDLRPGHAIIAPTRHHLVVDEHHQLAVRDGPPIGGHRPSGDRLLMSLARHASPRAIGLVLSGMGHDGAAGLTALAQSGCPTLAQDEQTSVVYGMPRAASARGIVEYSLPDTDIAAQLVELVASYSPRSPSDR